MRWLLALCLLEVLAAQKLHEQCAPCHTSQSEDFASHPHAAKGLSCDACHGRSKDHLEALGNRPPDKVAGPVEQPALCGACHAAQGKAYAGSKHGSLVAARTGPRAAACTTCHGTHALRAAAAMVVQCRRCHEKLPASCGGKPPLAARVSCAGCHDGHTLAAARQ